MKKKFLRKLELNEVKFISMTKIEDNHEKVGDQTETKIVKT